MCPSELASPYWPNAQGPSGFTKYLDVAPLSQLPRIAWRTSLPRPEGLLLSPLGLVARQLDGVTVIDPSTGKVRFRAGGLLGKATIAGSNLLWCVERNRQGILQSCDLKTGNVAWTQPLDEPVVALAYGAATLLMLQGGAYDSKQVVTAWNLADGAAPVQPTFRTDARNVYHVGVTGKKGYVVTWGASSYQLLHPRSGKLVATHDAIAAAYDGSGGAALQSPTLRLFGVRAEPLFEVRDDAYNGHIDADLRNDLIYGLAPRAMTPLYVALSRLRASRTLGWEDTGIFILDRIGHKLTDVLPGHRGRVRIHCMARDVVFYSSLGLHAITTKGKRLWSWGSEGTGSHIDQVIPGPDRLFVVSENEVLCLAADNAPHWRE